MHACRARGETSSLICGNPSVSVAFPATEFRRALVRWYRQNGRDLPWRRTRDTYAIVVSEFMLQQTQVASVIPYFRKWLRRFHDFAALARASEQDVLHAWQGLGYYARARNLHATAKIITHRHGGRFPQSVEQMQQLPGIGKYTTHAIASFAFDQPLPIIESNTARVLTRVLDFRHPVDQSGGRKLLWKHAATLVPKRSARIYNAALTDLGALVCLPRRPRCGICPVRKICRAKTPESLPIKKARARTIRLTENRVLISRSNRILLQKADSRWRGMWILPPLSRRAVHRRPIYQASFPFTHHRIALNVYAPSRRKIDSRNRAFAIGDRHSLRWIQIDALESIPIPSPHRRALRHLLGK